MRSSTDIKIAGVCAGLAEYLGWDVTIGAVAVGAAYDYARAIFPGVIGYIVCWLVMPVAPLPVPATAPVQHRIPVDSKPLSAFPSAGAALSRGYRRSVVE